MKKVKDMDNVEFIAYIMTYSRYGALVQGFVIEAIFSYASQVAECDPNTMETGMVNPHAWHGVAVELSTKLSEKYGSRSKNNE